MDIAHIISRQQLQNFWSNFLEIAAIIILGKFLAFYLMTAKN